MGASCARIADRVEVVGQHDHMLLTSRGGARQLVDGNLSAKGERALSDYGAAWEALVTTRHKIELLGGGRRELERELEMVQFQAEEIETAGFSGGAVSATVKTSLPGSTPHSATWVMTGRPVDWTLRPRSWPG